MGTFLSELGFVLGVLVGLGLAGGWVIVPFRSGLPYAVLATPLAGLLCVVLGTAVLYGIGGLPLDFCAVLSAACCIALTIVSIGVQGVQARPRPWLIPALTALLIAIVTTITVDAATLRCGGPAVLYTHGTDHLGYAQLSDWLASYPISVPPKATPQRPNAAWAEFVFKSDPRFGSFYFLGMLQLLRGRSGAFSFDAACVVALCAGILGAAGVFARSWRSLLLLIIGLTVSCWFDYSRCGYLGKILGYPSAVLVLGLFFAATESPSLVPLGLLVLIAGAASTVYPGVAAAMLITAVALPYLLSFGRSNRSNRAVVLGVVVLVCLLASGLAARPIGILSSRNGSPGWQYLLPRILDLENQVAPLSGFTPDALTVVIAAPAFVWAMLIAASLVVRDAIALGLLSGPLVLLAFLAAAGGWVPVLQLIGVLYPFALCGGARLVDDLPEATSRWQSATVLVLTGLMVILRVPRYAGAVRRYAGSEMYSGWIFSRRDTDRLVRAIRGRTVLVDIDHPNQAIFVVTEIGRRNVSLQWTPRTWRTLFSYTDLRLPQYTTRAQLKLVSATQPDEEDRILPVVFQTANLKLLDVSRSAAQR